MFKWLRWRRQTTLGAEGVEEHANRIVAKSIDRVEPPSDLDPIAELVRIVGESHLDDPRPRGDGSGHLTIARRTRSHRRRGF